jgi:hypothetical protein
MTNRNDGEEFERAVELFYSSLLKGAQNTRVERRVQRKGLDGFREIDILITARIADFDVLTVVECKDHSKEHLINGFGCAEMAA